MRKTDKNQTLTLATPTMNGPLKGYEEFLLNLKARIRSAQIKATLSVNLELILLYWRIGRDILRHQKEKGWGAKVIDRLAVDLRHAFPEVQGFSSRNLKYMRAFSEAYPDEQFVQQVAAQIAWFHKTAYREFEERVGQIKGPRGSKTELVEAAIHKLSSPFMLSDLERSCPGVSRDMIRKVLRDLRKSGQVECLGRGPGAPWRRKGITSKRG